MQFVEDTSIFFNEFGSDVVLGSNAFKAIFDKAYLEQIGIDCTGPVLMAVESDFVGTAEGDALTVDGVAYEISKLRPDGTGFVLVDLFEA